jgi:hypothetical protein
VFRNSASALLLVRFVGPRAHQPTHVVQQGAAFLHRPFLLHGYMGSRQARAVFPRGPCVVGFKPRRRSAQIEGNQSSERKKLSLLGYWSEIPGISEPPPDYLHKRLHVHLRAARAFRRDLDIHGGDYANVAMDCRSAYRNRRLAWHDDDNNGFRACLLPDPDDRISPDDAFPIPAPAWLGRILNLPGGTPRSGANPEKAFARRFLL